MHKPIMIALDFPEVRQVESFLQLWKDEEKPILKVGYQLFYQVGLSWVAQRKAEGYPIFLDLKLHDIPQTVAGAIQSLKRCDIDFLTLHASGGTAMMQAAKEAAAGTNIQLLAVTQLTSTDQQALNHELQITGSMESSVVHLSQLANQADMDGVICSAGEVEKIKQATETSFLCVTPGIRPEGDQTNDQKRVATPARAIEAGADYLVIGRPITRSQHPIERFHQIQEEILQAKGKRK